MEWDGVPVAPEARRKDYSLFGDQFSNFNAGKILLVLEGIGGLRYTVTEDAFTFADALPRNWTYMEFRVPVLPPRETQVMQIGKLICIKYKIYSIICSIHIYISYTRRYAHLCMVWYVHLYML